jgi:hypothetical protein
MPCYLTPAELGINLKTAFSTSILTEQSTKLLAAFVNAFTTRKARVHRVRGDAGLLGRRPLLHGCPLCSLGSLGEIFSAAATRWLNKAKLEASLSVIGSGFTYVMRVYVDVLTSNIDASVVTHYTYCLRVLA